jgi:hypothetical protein
MHNAAGNNVEIEASDRNDAHGTVVSDLVSLIEHVRASLKLIEQVTARETSFGNQETCADIIVLDDVTPRYLMAVATLNACDANLGIALHSLREPTTSPHGSSELAGRQPALSIIHACADHGAVTAASCGGLAESKGVRFRVADRAVCCRPCLTGIR